MVWLAHYQTWGEIEQLEIKAIDCPFRFPGQYFDEESGLHYNRFRYYDPQTGRFISPDPIGIAGGLNTYRYALNPLRSIDPFGLSPNFCPNSESEDFFIENEFQRYLCALGAAGEEMWDTYLVAGEIGRQIFENSANIAIYIGGALAGDEYARQIVSENFAIIKGQAIQFVTDLQEQPTIVVTKYVIDPALGFGEEVVYLYSEGHYSEAGGRVLAAVAITAVSAKFVPNKRIPLTTSQIDEITNLNVYGIQAQKILMGNNGKVAVIGRPMGDLKNSSRGGEVGVVDYTRQLRAQGYDTELFAGSQIKQAWFDEIEALRVKYNTHILPDEVIYKTTFYKENIKWARKLRKKNYAVIDIGNISNNPNLGPFYGGELDAVFNNAPLNKIINFKKNNNY